MRARLAVPWILVFALATLAMLAFRPALDKAHVSLVYLLIALGASSRAGRGLGIGISVIAFLAINFFFVPPYHTFRVAQPLDWLVLAAFLVTSVVAAQLLDRARSEAAAARQRAEEIDRLAGLGAEAKALRRADELKDALLASVSHDLRTPLTTIKALAHDIRMQGDERAATIEEEADRLNRFVADLLDLSRLAGGALAVRPEITAAEDLLGATIQRVTGALHGRSLDVQMDPLNPILAGRFDFVHSLRIVVNLIENAVRHSPPDGVVEVTAHGVNGSLEIAVADRGPGVRADERARIFEPFYRPDGAAPDASGAGLGLSIARQLAEAQNGSLEYRPRKGGGSEFVLRLPIADVSELLNREG